MKRLVYVLIALMVLGLFVSGCESVVPNEDLSRGTRVVFYPTAYAIGNELDIKGAVNLNVKTDMITINISNAVPDTMYEILLTWGVDGEMVYWPTSNDKGQLRGRFEVGLDFSSLWDANDLVIEISQNIPLIGFEKVLTSEMPSDGGGGTNWYDEIRIFDHGSDKYMDVGDVVVGIVDELGEYDISVENITNDSVIYFRYCEQNNNCWGYLVELVPDESHDLYMNVVNFTHTLISVEPFKYKNKHAWTITIARE